MIRQQIVSIVLAGALLPLSLPAARPQEPGAPPQDAATTQQEAPAEKRERGVIVVPTGTRLGLVLHNGISSQTVRPGQVIYFETHYPVVVKDHLVIPVGSYVGGVVEAANRKGGSKRRGKMLIRLNQLVLPNGYAVGISARPTYADAGNGRAVDQHGTIKGRSRKGKVAKSIAWGAVYGYMLSGGVSFFGSGKILAAGTAAGAAIGLANAMLELPVDKRIPRGTTFDVVLEQPIELDAARVQFTDTQRATPLQVPPPEQRPRPDLVRGLIQ